ncbi:hypothetical protein ACEN4A_08645 [Latilactobacillus sakei]|uniref:hypothetical protein n=1 Tax=Latilactobacillus sakei TaxID=1599 RepID=UPI0038876D78
MKMTLINSGLAVVVVISLAFIPMVMNRAPQQTAKVASVKQVNKLSVLKHIIKINMQIRKKY